MCLQYGQIGALPYLAPESQAFRGVQDHDEPDSLVSRIPECYRSRSGLATVQKPSKSGNVH